MKRHTSIVYMVAVALCAVSSAALARDTAEAGRLDDKTAGNNVRASQLIGTNIYNSEDKSVGEIKDIVIDAKAGKVRYAAVTYGGFLGVGDKLFAVPFEAFKCEQDPDDKDAHRLVLDVTQQQLDGAKGFDEEHWPNFADRNFTNELDKRYRIQRQRKDAQDGVSSDVDANHERRQ